MFEAPNRSASCFPLYLGTEGFCSVTRGGNVESGIKPGRRRLDWLEQCAELAWHWLSHTPQAPAAPFPAFPDAFLQLHRPAVKASDS